MPHSNVSPLKELVSRGWDREHRIWSKKDKESHPGFVHAVLCGHG